MAIPSLHNFSLVGGTALSLRYGHRNSVDLDLFSLEAFENSIIANELRKEFGVDFDFESGHRNLGILCYINKKKFDIV